MSSSCSSVAENVKEYYGKTLSRGADLKTGVCQLVKCTSPSVKAALALLPKEITDRWVLIQWTRNTNVNLSFYFFLWRSYGCGLPFPEAVEGCSVLDLGSGAGRDAFVFSSLVGADGKVVGVDMTDELVRSIDVYLLEVSSLANKQCCWFFKLEVAQQNINEVTEVLGYASPNVEFKKGFLEDLGGAGVPDNFFDCVVWVVGF